MTDAPVTTPSGAYIPPPLICPHGRQTVHCAECAPAAEERYREWQIARLKAFFSVGPNEMFPR